MIPRLRAGAGMTRFIEGRDRDQATLFPERLDEAIGADNPVRVVDAFIDALDLAELRRVRATLPADLSRGDAADRCAAQHLPAFIGDAKDRRYARMIAIMPPRGTLPAPEDLQVGMRLDEPAVNLVFFASLRKETQRRIDVRDEDVDWRHIVVGHNHPRIVDRRHPMIGNHDHIDAISKPFAS